MDTLQCTCQQLRDYYAQSKTGQQREKSAAEHCIGYL